MYLLLIQNDSRQCRGVLEHATNSVPVLSTFTWSALSVEGDFVFVRRTGVYLASYISNLHSNAEWRSSGRERKWAICVLWHRALTKLLCSLASLNVSYDPSLCSLTCPLCCLWVTKIAAVTWKPCSFKNFSWTKIVSHHKKWSKKQNEDIWKSVKLFKKCN